MTRSADKPAALDAFIARKAEIDVLLERLTALNANHFDISPDDINWGHVGTLAHYAELLKRIADAAFKGNVPVRVANWRALPIEIVSTPPSERYQARHLS